jgi:methionine synthase / methylenetetrahydrofolate reductase(NADPH)
MTGLRAGNERRMLPRNTRPTPRMHPPSCPPEGAFGDPVGIETRGSACDGLPPEGLDPTRHAVWLSGASEASVCAMASSTRPGTSFLAALRDGALVADGAMGTQIYERGVLFSVNYEQLNVSRPELVLGIHESYVRAGAQVLETNTFGANSIRLARHGLSGRVVELNAAAVKLAREAAGAKAYVVGAVGPTGLVMHGFTGEERARIKAAFQEQIAALAANGVDAILLETMHHPDEVAIAVEAAHAELGGKLPLLAQLSLNERLEMGDGTPVAVIGARLKELGVNGLGVNCAEGPQLVFAAAERLISLELPLIVMPNAGLPHKVDDRLIYVSTPEYFGVFAKRFFKLGVNMVGGCCGTTAEHIKKIAASARMAGARGPSEDPAAGESDRIPDIELLPPAPAGITCTAQADKSLLAGKIGRRFIVSVEVNPPVGLDVTKAIDAARMLTAGGIDVINIADGARAQTRMSNVALAVMMQQQLGIETIVHVCGRDRNLLGQVAHLLGAHALGLRNLVIITGDPPKMGDSPDATAVYDLDSVGILRLVARMNRGIDAGGKPLGAPTSFLMATGAEPAAINYPRELARLRQKKAAGAELVMTQPVYDPVVLERFLQDVEPLGLPVLVGVLPLASHRNAEFLHNEVPGMQIPEAIRERMRKAGSGAPARKEGVAIAREMLAAVRGRVAGAYIMPPLERYELALEVVDGFLDPPEPARAPAAACPPSPASGLAGSAAPPPNGATAADAARALRASPRALRIAGVGGALGPRSRGAVRLPARRPRPCAGRRRGPRARHALPRRRAGQRARPRGARLAGARPHRSPGRAARPAAPRGVCRRLAPRPRPPAAQAASSWRQARAAPRQGRARLRQGAPAHPRRAQIAGPQARSRRVRSAAPRSAPRCHPQPAPQPTPDRGRRHPPRVDAPCPR